MAVDDDDRRMAFARLRPLCSKLLDPRSATTVLEPLRKLLEDLPSSGVQSCAEYISFPLLLLLDAAVASRSQQQQEKFIISDKVAEGVVSCLEVLFARSKVTSSQQMAVLMRKLAAAIMLTPEQASEEFRHGVIKCLKAMFESLQCCNDILCPCKASKEAASRQQQRDKATFPAQGEDCVIVALQSVDISPEIGNLFFYLLQISHSEANRADAGSGAIRADALATLRVVMKKVGTADALAFFLPGIASGLNKVIRSARVTQRLTAFSLPRFYSVGAAGNSRSLEEAVRALAELLNLVLGDDVNSSSDVQSSVQSADAALEALQRLCQGATRASSEGLRSEVPDDKSEMKVMRVERSQKWLEETAAHVNTVLFAAFPALCAHTAAAVRLALADAAGTIASTCQQSLAKSMPILLETLLALACDDSKSVTVAATQYLTMITAGSTSFSQSLFSGVINRLLEELPKAVLAEDEGVALLHARQLAASMYLAGPSGVFKSLFQSPASSSRFVSIMTQCLTTGATFTGSLSRFKAIESLSLSDLQQCNEVVAADKLPRPPPWFDQAGKAKLYALLALSLRIAGYSSATGSSARTAIIEVLDSLQATLRDCAAHASSWDLQNSTSRMLYESGKLRRAASTAVCALNEIIYGASGVWLENSFQLFGEAEAIGNLHRTWTSKQSLVLGPHLVDATGTVLHDYLELWDLPVCEEATSFESGSTEGALHLLQDNATLQQVLVEGVGVCGMVLGPSFFESGFIGLVIYPLLEKLGCSTYAISHAARVSLQAICLHGNYSSVRELVVSNSDYVVDALCRQLRHITAYPHSPELLAAILQQTGAAADLLPFLEEPTRAMLLELEIAGRCQHPHLTAPILKALREIMKAARQGSNELLASGLELSGDKDKLLDKLLEHNRCQRSVMTVATCGITSSAPLMASTSRETSILAFDVIEHGMAALSRIEAAYKLNKARRQEVQSELSSEQDLYENEDINEANKLLPTMHQIWPHLMAALRHSHPSVVVKCLHVLASVAEDCGGDFLARRFHKDAIPLMLKLLQDDETLAPSRAEMGQIVGMNQRQRDLEQIVSQDSMLKAREAVLECITAIASSKRSSPALKMVAEAVVAKVVTVACTKNSQSKVKEAAMNTAIALLNVNSDLVWIMAADLAFESQQRKQYKIPAGFPSLDEILPPLSSTKDALCLQYAGVSGCPQLDTTAASLLLARIETHVKRV